MKTTRANSTLKACSLSKTYGGVKALNQVSFSLDAGCVMGIVGPNGAGKTTLFDVLTGMTLPDGGTAWYNDRLITGLSIESLGRLGVARTFQDGTVPFELTISEYLALAEPPRWLRRVGAGGERLPGVVEWREKIMNDVRPFLENLRSGTRVDRRCGELGLGEQKFLMVIRAVLRQPHVLLLDEPTQSFSADWTALLVGWLDGLSAAGSSVLLISHDMPFASRVCNQVLQMADGQIVDGDTHSGARSGRSEEADYAPCFPPDNDAIDPLLSINHLQARVNGFVVVDDVSFDIRPGEVLGIVGPNGAGKSTLLKTILGLQPRGAGTVVLEGIDVTSQPPFELSARGISLVLQGARLPARLFVEDALDLCWRTGGGAWSNTPQNENHAWRMLTSVEDLYALFPPLAARRFARAGVLSAGEQQLLAMAMALARRPKVLLLDEPSVGLHPSALSRLFQWLGELAGRGIALIIVEQQVTLLKRLARKGFVLEAGQVVDRWGFGSLRACGEEPQDKGCFI